MKKVIGMILAVLAAYLLFMTIYNVVPNDSPRALGHNVGTHLPWIITALVAIFLLRGDRKSGDDDKK